MLALACIGIDSVDVNSIHRMAWPHGSLARLALEALTLAVLSLPALEAMAVHGIEGKRQHRQN